MAAVPGVDYVSPVLGEEPFYYCRSCAEYIHVGNRKCNHEMSQLVNISEVRIKKLTLIKKTVSDFI